MAFAEKHYLVRAKDGWTYAIFDSETVPGQKLVGVEVELNGVLRRRGIWMSEFDAGLSDEAMIDLAAPYLKDWVSEVSDEGWKVV